MPDRHFRSSPLLRGALLAALPVLLLLAPAHGAALQVPDTIAQRVLACTACHAGTATPDPFFPRIAGKPAGYLYNQLRNFREGRRRYAPMTNMVDHLPDAYLKEIAEYFSAQHLPPPPVQRVELSAAELERGRKLVLEGDRSLQLPACIACHGERLSGVEPTIAGLAGLPRDYINAQLGNWRNRSRRAQSPDCMSVIANRLSLADVAAVSGWIAQRPLPPALVPAPATSIARPLPLACGSAPD